MTIINYYGLSMMTLVKFIYKILVWQLRFNLVHSIYEFFHFIIWEYGVNNNTGESINSWIN